MPDPLWPPPPHLEARSSVTTATAPRARPIVSPQAPPDRPHKPPQVEAVKSAMEVEVLADNEPAPASTSSFDEKHDLSIYEGPLAGSVRVQYQPTLSLFEFLLEERSSAAEAKSPIDAQVEEKVSALGLLQAELGHCTAALMSEKRQRRRVVGSASPQGSVARSGTSSWGCHGRAS